MREILRQQQRIVRQPLASTSDWTKWDGALVVSMWLLAFTRWGQYYLRQRGMTDNELDKLSQDAHELVIFRSIDEWRSMAMGKRSELVAFFDQAEGLLASSDESQSNPR